MKILPFLAALLLTGCAGVNGVFDIQPTDCSITLADVDLQGTVTDTELEGMTYIRRGKCDANDRAAARTVN